ncbi:MAG: hypothetical protein K2J84_07475 [Bacteroidaceae bacterium]|nr:hypothetical protein [Bacteroidaceae bacterium]
MRKLDFFCRRKKKSKKEEFFEEWRPPSEGNRTERSDSVSMGCPKEDAPKRVLQHP